MRKTTAGWKLLVKSRDQSDSWVKSSELKESHPVETAEFAKSRGIDDESAFAWWVPHTLKEEKCNHFSHEDEVTKNNSQIWYQNTNQH